MENLEDLESKGNEWYKDMIERMEEEQETNEGELQTIHYHSAKRPSSMKRFALD